jgi:hypothetical protein
MIEKVQTARMRLFAGSAVVSGPFELGVGTAMLVSLEREPARLELSLEGDPRRFTLQLELTSGELDVTTPRLEEHLVAPAHLALDAFGDRIEPTAASQ